MKLLIAFQSFDRLQVLLIYVIFLAKARLHTLYLQYVIT